MRTYLTSLLLTFIAFGAHAAEERSVPSRITAVKVFLNGAQVSRNASSTIPAGSSILVFTGLGQDLDPQSIQVNGKGGFSILSVNHRIDHLTESPKKKEIKDIDTRIEQLRHDRAIERGLQQVWENEEQLLQKNAVVSGQQAGLTAAQLQAVLDLQRERMKAMKAGWQAQQEKLERIDKEMAKLNAQRAELSAQQPRPTSEIVVEIDAPAEVNASFTLTYFVGSAGWVPAYDLRAKSTSAPIELLMKAQVVNSTGEDWNKVDLALSSGNPTQGGVMPQLQAWVLQQPYMLEGMKTPSLRRQRLAMAPAAAKAGDNSEMDGEMYDLQEMPAQLEVANTIVYNTTTLEFAIDAPFSIPADGAAHTVAVRTQTVAATYKHYCTPKLDKDAFLYARTTGWEELDLLPGQANVFFEGTYVGQSYLNVQRTTDTLDISLGRDKGIVVERVRRKRTDDKAALGGKRTITVGFDIVVRNTKSSAVDLEVRDQHPLSPRSEIEVKLVEDGGATVNEQQGSLTWQLQVEPKATRKLGFSYTVKHPKEMPVVVE